MGPHFFKCGKPPSRDSTISSQHRASMGPHFFKCGKSGAQPACIFDRKGASMGPHFFKCGKTGAPPRHRTTRRRFNGAALFQVWKACLRWLALAQPRGFNGAALFQVWKVYSDNRYEPKLYRLQWGRTFSSVESSAGPKS